MPARNYVGVARSRDRQKYIRLTAIVEREGRKWVAHCQELGTATHAATLEGALGRLKEAIELHLATLEDVGELQRFLDQQQITVFSYRPKNRFRFTVGRMPTNAVASPLIQKLPGHSYHRERELVTA
jgi:predicted RNase H-like HicB family nuclease